MPDAATHIQALKHPDSHQLHRILALIDEVTTCDGLRPLSEHVWLDLRFESHDDSAHFLAVNDEGALIGYAHLDLENADGPTAEVAVAPAARRAGVARALITAMLDFPAEGAPLRGRLRLWAHGEQASSARLAQSLGFERNRVLWQMRRSLFAPLSNPALPEGCTLRAFRPGEDDQQWLELNALVFAGLPDQASWTFEDLHRRFGEDWFSPQGFLIAESEGRMVGFHWTKVHGLGPHSGRGHDDLGEVYVVGVDPAFAGRGLGRAITLAGLHHLRSLGLSQAMLYVDASNTAAIALYEGLGFSRWDTDVLYRHRTATDA